DGIRGRSVAKQVVGDLVVIHAVKQEVVGLLAVAVDQGPAAITAGVVAVVKAAGIGRYRARSKQGQLDVIARGERQVIVGGGVDNGVELGRFRLQNRSFAADFDGLADLPDLHFDIDTRNLVEHE